MKRSALTRKTPLARASSLGRAKGLERAAPKAARAKRAPRRWTNAKADRCAACGKARDLGRYLILHHVFYAQHVEAQGADVWDPRNAATLCDGYGSCHAAHHDRSCPIRLADLPDSVFEFGREVFGGPAAFEYLARRYAAPDPRLDALLEEA